MNLVQNSAWFKEFSVSLHDIDAWKSKKTRDSFLFWALTNNIIQKKKYISWAVEHYKIPFLQDSFFEHSLITEKDLEKIKDLYTWSQEIMPVAVWNDVVFIGVLDPDTISDKNFDFEYKIVLVSDKSLKTIWNFTKKLSMNIVKREQTCIKKIQFNKISNLKTTEEQDSQGSDLPNNNLSLKNDITQNPDLDKKVIKLESSFPEDSRTQNTELNTFSGKQTDSNPNLVLKTTQKQDSQEPGLQEQDLPNNNLSLKNDITQNPDLPNNNLSLKNDITQKQDSQEQDLPNNNLSLKSDITQNPDLDKKIIKLESSFPEDSRTQNTELNTFSGKQTDSNPNLVLKTTQNPDSQEQDSQNQKLSLKSDITQNPDLNKKIIKLESSFPEDSRTQNTELNTFSGKQTDPDPNLVLKTKENNNLGLKNDITQKQDSQEQDLPNNNLSLKSDITQNPDSQNQKLSLKSDTTQNTGEHNSLTSSTFIMKNDLNNDIFQDLFKYTNQYFCVSVILNIKDEGLYFHSASGLTKDVLTNEKLMDLNKPSLFKVVVNRGHPYHGFPIQHLQGNQMFFEKIGWTNKFKHVSALLIDDINSNEKKVFIGLSAKNMFKASMNKIESIIFDFKQRVSQNLKQAS